MQEYIHVSVSTLCMCGKSGERHNELRAAVKRGPFLEYTASQEGPFCMELGGE
jgi:hypothetical protein